MDVLETLAVALGFATLAGLNLYMTVFVTGLAINMNWVDVSTKYPELQVLGEPAVLVASGIFFCLEFFSDKIPWVDSLWDTIHTLIRPVGGGLLAIHTLGPTEPAFDVIIALLAGGTTLVSHSFKAGTRLAINASPEPFSNVAASVGGDVAVLGGIALMWTNPILFAIVCIAFLSFSIYMGPKLFRRIKGFAHLLWHRFLAVFFRKDDLRLYSQLTADEDLLLSDVLGGEKPDVQWTARVLVGKSKKFKPLTTNTFGSIVAVEGEDLKLHFVGRRMFRDYHACIPLDSMDVVVEPKFLGDLVVLFDRTNKRKIALRLHAGHRGLGEKIAEGILELQGGDLSVDVPEEPAHEEKSEKKSNISKKDSEASVS
ncbi:MAG: DUF4126 domain-containing protein [Verrucomicrobiales bacterium]|nr:DUF4126 domain-containing protein [Verrucomicrobiales bacterium]